MFTTKGGAILENGSPLQIRGISHFGFNAEILLPMFLWAMGWKDQLAQIRTLGFNAVRCPFTPDTLYLQKGQDTSLAPINNDLRGLTPLQVLDLWMAECDRLGLYVLLDFHSVTCKSQYPTWFTTDTSVTYDHQPYTAGSWMRDLAFVAKRYAHLPHFFAIDIYNEPHSAVRWDVGDTNYDNTQPHAYWRPAVDSAAAVVLAANPNLLIFVQGTEANWNGKEKTDVPINYGENFQSQKFLPLNVRADKLVLSPHTYGPDVYVKTSFNAPNFPSNLAADWETLFGQYAKIFPVVIGEWGGRYGKDGKDRKADPRDKAWQNALVDYMISKGMLDSFYWCYTPNSGDSGGILNDDLTVNLEKMALLKRLWSAQAAPAPIPEPAPPPTVPKTLYVVMDTLTGTWYQIGKDKARVGTLAQAREFVAKSRGGVLESRTIIFPIVCESLK